MVSATLNDGNGSTSLPVSKTVSIGVRWTTTFQNGLDIGNGTYTDTADIQLLQTS